MSLLARRACVGSTRLVPKAPCAVPRGGVSVPPRGLAAAAQLLGPQGLIRNTRRSVAAPVAAAAAAAAGTAAASPVPTAATAAAAAAATAGSSSYMDMFAVLLGYGCLVGSCFRSVPQIAIILRTRSAEGLSLTSNLVELLCFTVTVAYNMQQGYAFNTYGEVFACWIQDVVIVGLIFRHMRLSGPVMAAATAAFAACAAWLFSAWCPIAVLSALQLSTVLVMALGARLPQIALNLRRGNAGVLSVATCVLNVAGCVVRIFTTVVLTGDAIILGGCVTQLLLNAILLYQAVATPGTHTAPTSAAAVVAATDPPLGGVGEARGHTQELAAGDAAGAGEKETQRKGAADGGEGGGFLPPSPLPAAA